jgi:hypothetical protein
MSRKLIISACLVLALGVINTALAATDPYPADGAVQPQTWVILTWSPGADTVSYDVYLGENLADVENATYVDSTFQGNQIHTFFLAGFSGFPYPEGLVPGTTYYWRIDEIWADGTIYKGTVWNFKVTPDQGWVPFIPGAEPETVHNVKLKASDNTGIAVDSDIPGMNSVNVSVEGQIYQRLSMPYVHYTTAVGKPKVPVIRRYLEIPYDVNYLTVEILYADPEILSGYNVYPAQQPLLDIETDEILEFVRDEKTYTTDAFYPADIAEVGESAIMRGHRITSLALFPVQFNPVKKQLRVYSKIEVRINYDRPAQIEGIKERLDSEAFELLCKVLLLNYRLRPRIFEAIGNPPSVDYLIITHADFETDVKPLADWKEKKGLRTKIVKRSDICTNADPLDDADEIAKYLQDAYDNWNPPPTYVLLVGDSDFIPTHYRTVHPGEDRWGNLYHGGNRTATDLYYSTLDGSDRFPDIFVGRISVDTAAQTTTIVNKIIDYEKNPQTNAAFYNDISVSAFFQDTDDAGTLFNESDGFEDRRFVLTSEEIRDFLLGQGYAVERIYNTDSAVNPTNYNNGDYDAGVPLPAGIPWNGNTARITNAFNGGRFIITHRDHGGSRNYWDERPAWANGQRQGAFDGWDEPRFTTANVPGLNNANELPVVFSMNCQTGWFDGETDPYNTWNFECFCEELLRHQNGGAVAVFGATRNSFSGYNDDLIRGFIDAIWPNFDPTMTSGAMFELGQVLVYGKVHMAVTPKPAWGDPNLELTEFEEFHLFGDPEMWIWTQQPTALTVTHPATIGSGGSQQFAVTVRDLTGQPVNHAAVGLLKNNDVHTAGYTNPSGYVILDVSPSTAGNMDITVTAHNHLPYEGTIAVTGNGANITVSPDTGPPGISLNIAGSNFSAGETVSIDLGGTNLGTASAAGGSFTQSFNIPAVPEGPTNVTAAGQTSGRVAVAVFMMMPAQPLPDPYSYSQWDSSTWHLNPSGGDPVWDNPCIQLKEQGTGNPVSSRDLRIGTPYIIEAKIHNYHTAVAANGINVNFKWALWGAGQKVWNIIDTDTVDIPVATIVPNIAVARAVWTPITTGHCCIVVEIDHPWDANLNNNKAQENTDVAAITSPAEVTFDVYNPTDARALVNLEATQTDPCEPGELWGTRIEREYPQVLEPGERQTATLEVQAPENASTGESRTISVTATIDGETIGGVEIQVIKDHPPVLTDAYVEPNSVVAGANITYWVTYTDQDNHPPMNGYPTLSVFKGGVPVSGSPFEMVQADPNDNGYADGKTYTCSITLSESGNDYTYCFWARDSLEVGAEGPATNVMRGPFVTSTVPKCIVIDDFESYSNMIGNGIFETWIDGQGYTKPLPGHPGNGTGSRIHLALDNYHGGVQSMAFSYTNESGVDGSQVYRIFETPQDWTRSDVRELSLWFHGDPKNDSEPMYVAVEDGAGNIAVLYHDNPNAAKTNAWTEWRIDLRDFAEMGVNLSPVYKIAIGFGAKGDSRPGGNGIVYFDDIQLCPTG